ncbi:MAG: DeoR/GlpR family DNA-binding transcription regulator [Clostridiales bacterium]|jgi:DeoR/GlpR family transcriptional regulator of sugar metabolism|nr:DeoR/GlpR family DNA-binding transcription regulator [Clostridiales bacterium]
MADSKRKEQILDFMRDKTFVTVDQLRDYLFVSGATVRRDLEELQNSRQIRRTRGGAVLVEGIANDAPLAIRESRNETQKMIIAGQACRLIKNGMTLFLDSSSTVFILARSLDQFTNLHVITNSLKTALFLSDRKDIQVMCTGGTLRPGSKSLVGQAAVEYVSRFNADAAFMSARGFSAENGASEASEDECGVKRAFIKNSRQRYLLCDASKMNVDYLCRIAALSQYDRVITEDRQLNERFRSTTAITQ